MATSSSRSWPRCWAATADMTAKAERVCYPEVVTLLNDMLDWRIKMDGVYTKDTIVRNNGQGTGGGIFINPSGSAAILSWWSLILTLVGVGAGSEF